MVNGRCVLRRRCVRSQEGDEPRGDRLSRAARSTVGGVSVDERHRRFGENQGLIVSEIARPSKLGFPSKLDRKKTPDSKRGKSRRGAPFSRARRAEPHRQSYHGACPGPSCFTTRRRPRSQPRARLAPSASAAMPGLFSRRSPTAGIAGFFRTGRAPSRAPTRAVEAGARVAWGRGSPSRPGPRDPRVSLPVRALAGGSRPSRRRRHRAPSAVALRGGTATCRRAVHRRGCGVAAARFDGRRAMREHPTRRSRARALASRSNPRAPASPRALPARAPGNPRSAHSTRHLFVDPD